MLVVAMLALPMSAAYATKPITMTLSGTYYMVGPLGPPPKIIEAGESGNILWKLKGIGTVWTGDITAGSLGPPPVPGGVYNGQWLVKGEGEGAFPGRFILEDVTIASVGSGDLTIGMWQERAIIESGSDDLRSIRGRGTVTLVSLGPPSVWDYELEIQINP